MLRPLSAAPLCWRRGNEVSWEPHSLRRETQREVMTIKENTRRSCCPVPGTQYVLNQWQQKLLLWPWASHPIHWALVLHQNGDGDSYCAGCWHVIGPPPVGALAIITQGEKDSQRDLPSSSLCSVYVGDSALRWNKRGGKQVLLDDGFRDSISGNQKSPGV